MAGCRTTVSLAFALAALGIPGSALAAPPGNDDYLKSKRINAPGARLPREVVKDAVDTREATTQTDLFSPDATGGGAEPQTCKGRGFGKTVWYDFHPDVGGAVEIQTGGFDVSITVYEFSQTSSRITSSVACSAEPGAQDFIVPRVRGGHHYTIQIGGLSTDTGPTGGDLQFSFQFFADRDGDNVFDPLDHCPTQFGVRAYGGCPPELHSTPKLTASPSANGIVVRKLSVSAPRGARVEVRCRRGCSFRQARTARVVSFPALRGRALPAGAVLELFVTKSRSIGNYYRYTIARGNFKRTDRCLKPGSHKPRRKCT